MWYFEAVFYNLDTGVEENKTIQVDTCGFNCSEDDVWCIAVSKALKYSMPLVFNSLKLISC